MRFKGKLFLNMSCWFGLMGCSPNTTIELDKNSNVVFLSNKGIDYFNSMDSYNIFEVYLLENYNYAMTFLTNSEYFVVSNNFESMFDNNCSVLLTIFGGSSDSSLEVKKVYEKDGDTSFNFNFSKGVLEDVCFHIDCFRNYA